MLTLTFSRQADLASLYIRLLSLPTAAWAPPEAPTGLPVQPPWGHLQPREAYQRALTKLAAAGDRGHDHPPKEPLRDPLLHPVGALPRLRLPGMPAVSALRMLWVQVRASSHTYSAAARLLLK